MKPLVYAENIGKHLFKKIDMRVDETILETYNHDIGLIYDELYTDSSEKLSKIYTDVALRMQVAKQLYIYQYHCSFLEIMNQMTMNR
jgi:hypothetical protein